MLAAFVPEPGVLEVEEFEIPELADAQVLVRMGFSSICGSDVHIVFDRLHNPDYLGRPGYPGHEGVGTVVHSRSTRVPEGAVVLTVPLGSSGGCFAEYQAIDDTQVIVLPAGEDPRRLMLAQQLGTTIYAMHKFVRPEVPPARTALVIGAGSAGLFFLQHLQHRGAETVVVADLDENRLGIAKRLGATVTVHAPGESVVDAVRDLTGGAGADLVIEAAGYDSCRADAVDAACDRGTVGFFGYPERFEASPFPVGRSFRKSLTMEWINGTQREPGLRSFHDALDAIRAGSIEVDYCLESSYPLDQTPTALAVAREQGHGAAKVGLTIA